MENCNWGREKWQSSCSKCVIESGNFGRTLWSGRKKKQREEGNESLLLAEVMASHAALSLLDGWKKCSG